MNRFLSFSLASLVGFAWLAVGQAHASHEPPSTWNTVHFDAETSSDFSVGTNWADDGAPTTDGQTHVIENGLTAELTGTATVNGVIVGDETTGTFNINGGTLNIDVGGGFPRGFSIGGHIHNLTGNGTVNLTNGAVVNLSTAGGSPDSAFVGERADGTLNVGGNSIFNAPGITWRIGQFGGFFGPTEFDADGTINVEDDGQINSFFWYLGPNGGDAIVRVSDNGSINLSLGFDARAIANNPLAHSATIEMIGSNASWESGNMRFDTINGAPRNQVIFTADAGGVSPMVTTGLLDYNDAELTVDLTAFGELALFEKLLLFDGPGGELAGETFGAVNVLGVADPSKYALIYYNQGGNISLARVPEPSTLALVALALFGLTIRRVHRG